MLAGPAGAETDDSGISEGVEGLTEQFEDAPGVVHLTFDDGPDQAFTPVLLNLLDRHGAKATFFPLGRNLKPRWDQDDVQDLLSRGQIGRASCKERV